MDFVFFILLVLSFIALVLGLFKPSLVLKKLPKEAHNRSTVIKLYLTATIFFFLLTGSTAGDGFFSVSTMILLTLFIIIEGYVLKDYIATGNIKKQTFEHTDTQTKRHQKPESHDTADVEIIYQKPDGEITKRKVKVEKVNDEYMRGFCFLRDGERTFKLDRILELKDLSTGIVYEDPEEIKDFLIAFFPYKEIIIDTIDYNHTTSANYIDEGYFYGKVDENLIADINHDFHILYEGGIEFDAAVIRLGKEKFTNRYFLLIRNLENDEFAGLYVDKIIEMFDLETGESILNLQKYFDDIYEKELLRQRERERKRIQKENIEKFIDEYSDLLKALVYIAKSDGTLNAKEKSILIETLENFDSSVQDPAKIIDKVVKNHLYFTSYNSFAYHMKKIIDKYSEIDFLDYAEKIISTQKKIHTDEQKILDYLSKAYNREYSLNYEKEFKANHGVNCPHCHSKHTIKKGKREYKDHINQRYECQECGKIFSIKQEKED